MCRTVMQPRAFLPPVFFLVASRDFSGLVVVISSNAETDMPLLPGEVGLYFLIAMIIPS